MILFCGFDVKKHLNQYVNYFSIPAKLFALFEPSITKYSIQYANGEDGKSRRFDFDKTFSHENLVIYYDKFQKVNCFFILKLNCFISEALTKSSAEIRTSGTGLFRALGKRLM